MTYLVAIAIVIAAIYAYRGISKAGDQRYARERQAIADKLRYACGREYAEHQLRRGKPPEELEAEANGYTARDQNQFDLGVLDVLNEHERGKA